eukprot:6069903-Amphidinium_carterae.1
MIASWLIWLPSCCWISSLLELATVPSSKDLLAEKTGILSFFAGFLILSHLAGLNAVRGLLLRTSRASQGRAFSAAQTMCIWAPFLTLMLNSYLRVSVADVFEQVDKDSSKRAEILNASNYGTIVRRPVEAALGVGLVTIIALVMCDVQRIYSTYLAIVAQSIQSALGGVPFTFNAQESLIVDFVCYQADSLWSIRQLVVDGALTTPQLSKLLYVVQKATKTSSRQDRISLDNCLGHVANVLK